MGIREHLSRKPSDEDLKLHDLNLEQTKEGGGIEKMLLEMNWDDVVKKIRSERGFRIVSSDLEGYAILLNPDLREEIGYNQVQLEQLLVNYYGGDIDRMPPASLGVFFGFKMNNLRAFAAIDTEKYFEAFEKDLGRFDKIESLMQIALLKVIFPEQASGLGVSDEMRSDILSEIEGKHLIMRLLVLSGLRIASFLKKEEVSRLISSKGLMDHLDSIKDDNLLRMVRLIAAWEIVTADKIEISEERGLVVKKKDEFKSQGKKERPVRRSF